MIDKVIAMDKELTKMKDQLERLIEAPESATVVFQCPSDNVRSSYSEANKMLREVYKAFLIENIEHLEKKLEDVSKAIEEVIPDEEV